MGVTGSSIQEVDSQSCVHELDSQNRDREYPEVPTAQPCRDCEVADYRTTQSHASNGIWLQVVVVAVMSTSFIATSKYKQRALQSRTKNHDGFTHERKISIASNYKSQRIKFHYTQTCTNQCLRKSSLDPSLFPSPPLTIIIMAKGGREHLKQELIRSEGTECTNGQMTWGGDWDCCHSQCRWARNVGWSLAPIQSCLWEPMQSTLLHVLPVCNDESRIW